MRAFPIGATANRLLFVGGLDDELWSTDGTVAGTTLVANIPGGINALGRDSSTSDTVFFSSVNPPAFWATDGTAGGTRQVTTGVEPQWRGFLRGGYLYFGASDAGALGFDPWRCKVQ
jgi:ELWxxDGT repeat protein